MAGSTSFIQNAFNYGWETFKKNTGFLIGYAVALGVATMIPGILSATLFTKGSAASVVFNLLSAIFNMLVGMATTRVALDIYDKGQADLDHLGSIFSDAVSYVAAHVVYWIVMVLGLMLFIIPGLIVAYMFFFVGYLVVDKHLGPIETLKASAALTKGHKWNLFFFSMAMLALNLVGLLCFGIGLLVTIPISILSFTYVYRQLSPAGVSA